MTRLTDFGCFLQAHTPMRDLSLPLLSLLLLMAVTFSKPSHKPSHKPAAKLPPTTVPYGSYNYHDIGNIECLRVISDCRTLDEAYKLCLHKAGCVEPGNPQCKAAAKECEPSLTHCIINHDPDIDCLEYVSAAREEVGK